MADSASVAPQGIEPAEQSSDRGAWISRRRLLATRFGWIACISAIAFVSLVFPRLIATTDLDQSWGQALGYFYNHRFQAGVDYIFTYGPLGYFISRMYDRDLYFQYYFWEVIIKVLYAFALIRLARSYVQPIFGVLLLAVLAFLSFRHNFEALFRTFILALAVPLILAKRSARGDLFFSCAILAVIAQIKFDFCLLGLAAVAAAELPIRVRKPLTVLSPLTIYVLAFLLVWVALGQSVLNLPRYIIGSWQIASGYADAMAFTDPEFAGLAIAAGSAGLILWLITVIYLTAKHAVTPARLSLALLLLFNAYVAWKHGVVRADLGHLPLMLCYMLVLWLMVPLLADSRQPPVAKDPSPDVPTAARWRWIKLGRILFVCGSVGLCVFASFIYLRATDEPWSGEPLVYSFNTLIHPVHARALLDSARKDLARDSELPVVKAQVGGETIDVMSCSQGVLLINDLNYRPRPVFQSYSSYTPYLIEANARFYRSQRAPKYVLFKLESLTGFPALEDSQALMELVRLYRPILRERDFILFQRSPEADCLSRTPAAAASDATLERRLKWGEQLNVDALGGNFRTLSMRIKPSFIGLIRSLLYKPPNVRIIVRTMTGDTFTERIDLLSAQTRFILSPTLECFGIIDFYQPSSCSEVSWVSFATDDPSCFDADFHLTLGELPKLGCTLEPGVVNYFRYPKR